MTMTYTTPAPGLPDPVTQGEFYRDVTMKRFIAWVIDVIVVSVFAALVVVATVGIGLFFIAAIWLAIDFLYRLTTMTTRSATWGMRLVSIEFRDFRGLPFGLATALVHTLGYMVSMGFGLPQVISVIMMVVTPRGQGLTDMVLGTAPVNLAARG